MLFLETTQSDQNFSPLILVTTSEIISLDGKNGNVELHFQHDKKCLTRTLLFSLLFIEGLRYEIAEINQCASHPYTHTHTHTHTHTRVVAVMELWDVLLSCNGMVSRTFICVHKTFEGKTSETLCIKTCTEQFGANGNPSNLYSGSARFNIAPGRYGFPSFLHFCILRPKYSLSFPIYFSIQKSSYHQTVCNQNHWQCHNIWRELSIL
jgi:hypothetical protein